MFCFVTAFPPIYFALARPFLAGLSISSRNAKMLGNRERFDIKGRHKYGPTKYVRALSQGAQNARQRVAFK